MSLSFFNFSCTVVSDASDHGLGAVLLQEENGVQKPVAFASQSLSPQEKKYATTERECLALVFAITKFHNYLFGKKFTAIVDHKPLESLISNVRKRASARIERWNLVLQNYNFQIIHKPGRENIADLLVPHDLNDSGATNDTNSYVNFIVTNALPISVTLENVKEASANDVAIKAVTRALETGDWSDDNTALFREVKHELSVNDGILLKCNQIVLPTTLHRQAVDIAHQGHLGIQKSKALLR